MSNVNVFWNNIDCGVAAFHSLGAEIADKFGSQPLQNLETDQHFLVCLASLRLELWMPNAAAMLASREVGIKPTSDGLRVVLAYISTDEDFLTRVGNKAYWLALALSKRAEAEAASATK